MIRACLQVARTYATRARFWIFGGVYLVVAWQWGRDVEPAFVVVSAVLASIVACFVALHLRRQFASPSAKMVPHFALPHLVVGGLASLTLWVGVPTIQAWMMELPAWGPIGVHAAAGLFLVLVACWRQAILLLAAVPVVLFATQLTFLFDAKSIGTRFITGHDPVDSAILIGLTILAHPLAAWFLLRLSDQDASVSDDFAVEAPRSDRGIGRLDELLLAVRDASVRHRLADVGHGWWAIQRWRIPVTISWVQLAIALVLGVGLAGLSAWSVGDARGGLMGLIVATTGMLIAPFNGWHMRRGAVALEFMRPVARLQFFSELAAAVALDVCLWTALASVFAGAGFYAVAHSDPQIYSYLATLLAFLWSAAVLFYGVGLATMRLRYWLPVMVGMVVGWTVLASISVSAYLAAMTRSPATTFYVVLWTSLAWAVAGLALAAATLVRWTRSDVG